MATIGNIDSALQIILPKRKSNDKGVAYTSTFNPTATTSVLSLPSYRQHLTDIFTSRVSQDARALMKDLFKYNSDVSAAVYAYLTVCNTEPRFYVYDVEGNLDREGQQIVDQLIVSMTKRNDYSQGFMFSKSLREIAEECRYMVLLRGGVAGEMVFNKFLTPREIRQVDLATVEWFETAPGVFKPQQRPPGASNPIDLDIPTLFVKLYRQNPTEIYPESCFVSAINTIAAREQVVNDLYRIMQKTGYPRLDVTVVEEVLRKNVPSNIIANETEVRNWMNARIAEIQNGLNNMRADSAFVHTDAVEAQIVNQGGPGKAMDVTAIIEVLNSTNQAALKVVSTLIGRGTSGVNTASVEARVFSMQADSLNGVIADFFSDALTLAARMTGYEGYVECVFDPVELRPATELEPHLTMRQARLLENLSLGLITDDEYHIEMFGRLRPDSAPELSGTNFMAAGNGASVDAQGVSPNSDPLGRSIASPDAKSARAGGTQKKATGK